MLDHSNPPFARWFCGGTTNLCHNAIDRWLEKQPDALALIAVSSETEEERTFTFRQLYDEVNVAAAMLLSLGVQRGDRVLVYMPMIAEGAHYAAGLRTYKRSIRWCSVVSPRTA